MQINKRSVFTRVLLVLYPVCSQKGGLLIIELFNHHQILNLGLTAVTIWRLLDNGLVFEYTLRKTYPYVASVPGPMFSNSYIYIITYILSI